MSESVYRFLHLAWILSPVWVMVFLASLWVSTWVSYRQRDWMFKQGTILLEIRLPRDILRSPAAMEIVLSGIYEPVVGTFLDTFLKGKLRPWFSLEIVSLGGQVKFFIWALPAWKKNIEARLYAQYPNIEVHEVPDYTKDVHYNPDTMNMTSFQTELVKSNVYPIKTYIDFGLDKKGDEEEEKIDPITPLIEWLGSLKQGEQAWIQIMIQAHRKEGLTDARVFTKSDWKPEVKKEIQKIYEEAVMHPEADKKPSMMDLSTVQKDTIDAIQRSQGKLPYDAMIRAIYIADKDKYNSMATAGMIHSFRHIGSSNLNGIKPVFSGLDYPWQDFQGKLLAHYRLSIIDAYKRRSAFNGLYRNWNAKPYVLNTEELATLFHFPGAVSTTPSLSRIPSKKAEAPANLPI